MTNQKYNNQTNEEYNKERFRKRTRKDLDDVISDQVRRSNAYKYDPDVFRRQIDWIKDKFYRTTGASNKTVLMMRQREDAKDDMSTNETASYEAFLNNYDDDVDLIIDSYFHKLIPVVASQVYNPKTKAKYFVREGAKFTNTYQPPLLNFTSLVTERPKIWQEYLDRLMPRDQMCVIENRQIPQQKFFEQWIVQRVKHPYKPLEINLILRGDQGTGKNFWCDFLLKPILGKTNVYTGSTKDLKSDYKKQIYQSVLFHIEEFDDKRNKLNEILKAITTQADPYIGDKFLAKTQMQKYFSIAISTNAKFPLTLEKGDRRNFVACYSEHRESRQESQLFFARFTRWLEEFAGYQIMNDYFHSTPIELDFADCPLTNAKIELTEQESYLASAENDLILWLQDPIQHKYAYSPLKLQTKYKLPVQAIQNCLRQAGFISTQKRWRFYKEGNTGTRMRLWISKTRTERDNYSDVKLYNQEDGSLNIWES